MTEISKEIRYIGADGRLTYEGMALLQSFGATPTISITTADFDPATLVTEAEGITANDNDTTIPTSAAVDAHIPLKIAAAAYGSVGSLAYCMINGQITEGTTYAGANLFPAGIYGAAFPAADGGTATGLTRGGTALAGTWRALGRSNIGGGQPGSTLFLRIS